MTSLRFVLFYLITIIIYTRMEVEGSVTSDDVYSGTLASCQSFAATF